jgi:O-antigen/teichoic acid export membrane protein
LRDAGLLPRVLKNLGKKSAGEVVTRAAAAALYILAIRLLGERGWGIFAFGLAYSGMWMAVADLGLQQHLVRSVAPSHGSLRRTAGLVLGAKVWLGAAAVVLALATARAAGFSGEQMTVVALLVPAAVLQGWMDFYGSVTASVERMEYDLLTRGGAKLFIAAAGLLVLARSPDPASFAAAILAASCIAAAGVHAVLAGALGPLSPALSPKAWAPLLKKSLPVGLFFLFNAVYVRVDVTMLSWLGRGTEEVGWYGAASRIIEISTVVPFLLSGATFPILADMRSRDPAGFRRLSRRLVGTAFGIGAAGALAGSLLASLLPALLGEGFHESVRPFRILVFALPFAYGNFIAFTILMADGASRPLVGLAALGAALNVGANLLLIPRYGHVAAAATTLATEAVVFALACVRLRRLGRPVAA